MNSMRYRSIILRGGCGQLIWAALSFGTLPVVVSGGVTSAETAEFTSYAAPTIPAKVGQPLANGAITLSGGALSNGYWQPWDGAGVHKVVYSSVGPCPGCQPKCPGCEPTNCEGCAVECAGCLPAITIDFGRDFYNIHILVQTRSKHPATYYYQDDRGRIMALNLDATQGVYGSMANLFVDGNFDQTLPTRRVTIFTYDPSWDFAIIFVTGRFPGAGAFDPMPELLSGNHVLADPPSLATLGTSAYSIAADGVARLVLRLGAAKPGETFTVTLYDTCCSSIPSVPSESGTLATIDNQDSPAQSVTVTAQNTGLGPMAFVIYRAPADFTRPGQDETAAYRMVNIHASSQLYMDGTDVVLSIMRPPVVLVHGLWGSRADWNPFAAVVNDQSRRFFVRRAVYDYDLQETVTATIPVYTDEVRRLIRGSALGFDFAAPPVMEQINQFLVEFRQQNSTAAAQADVIAHSMGGTVARTLINLPRYLEMNYGGGLIHKLVTIGTPHQGSPLARDLIQDANTRIRNLLARYGNAAISSATVAGLANQHGGAGDLQPGSGALNDMQSGSGPLVPTALVAAITTAANTASLDSSAAAAYIRFKCSGDPVVARLTAQGWRTEFGGDDNDAIVALSSQLNLLPSTAPGNPVPGLIHSAGVARLGFTGPTELNDGALQAIVVNLLNDRVSEPTRFYPLR